MKTLVTALKDARERLDAAVGQHVPRQPRGSRRRVAKVLAPDPTTHVHRLRLGGRRRRRRILALAVRGPTTSLSGTRARTRVRVGRTHRTATVLRLDVGAPDVLGEGRAGREPGAAALPLARVTLRRIGARGTDLRVRVVGTRRRWYARKTDRFRRDRTQNFHDSVRRGRTLMKIIVGRRFLFGIFEIDPLETDGTRHDDVLVCHQPREERHAAAATATVAATVTPRYITVGRVVKLGRGTNAGVRLGVALDPLVNVVARVVVVVGQGRGRGRRWSLAVVSQRQEHGQVAVG